MKKIGLALSGGGFRASLYHLGLVRFLRDAGILPQVTHITSVSGGSIFAAHLVLNWGRYTGSASEFDAAAAEILNFIRLDIRNRIVRRFPLAYLLRWPRRLLGYSNRRMTRPGLLEFYYERFLFGDRSLFELPANPQLYILATNLSEGCLCSFSRDGLWMMRHKPGSDRTVDRVHVGLATVAMAVAASSAFPGFFPPFELTGRDVGARGGEFARQAYTDGGVFDNLGVRMFRFLDPMLAERKGLDGVLVSDVGKRIEVQAQQRSSGLIRTAMRSSEILMDRVWQLESETFHDEPGFVFARINDLVKPEDDLTAMHPEIQRQAANIRTDLDCFSPLEMSSLIRHGYCVGRQACKSRPDLFGAELPVNAPWDPVDANRETRLAMTPVSARFDPLARSAAPTTAEARKLQASALRRIWSSLLDFRDWTSYVYVPIIVPLLFLFPYFVYKSYQHSYRVNRLIESISQGSPDFDIMSKLLDGPMPTYLGESADEVQKMEPLNFKGFTILQDSRILDLRNWNPSIAGKGDTSSMIYGYRRLKVMKDADSGGQDVFRIGLMAQHPKTLVRFPVQHFHPKLSRMCSESLVSGEKICRYEMNVDFQKVPAGEVLDLIYEHYSPGTFVQRGDDSSTLTFRSEADTAEVSRWFLMPQGREYKSFRMLRYETGKPSTTETVKGMTEYLAQDSTILAFKMVSVKAGYTYEVTWLYR